jgi:hypothetical protein
MLTNNFLGNKTVNGFNFYVFTVLKMYIMSVSTNQAWWYTPVVPTLSELAKEEL